MPWTVKVARKAAKRALQLPERVQILLKTLLVNLETPGPIQHEWPNYSRLADGRYHCHLSYWYVVVWVEAAPESKVIEVTYVGGRENAPY
ncbi:MAG: cytotoxic translational repressor of toxin-antitoxin stability system [Gammaproteobacteria bacterium]|nr:cytotoxic translational repressor of toxin-antitoxin stability system [Gammaproteobacteria bacterium]